MNAHTTWSRAIGSALVVVSVAALAACGGGSSAGSTAAAASTPAATSSPNATNGFRRGAGGFGIDAATRTKITACLKAAGIAVPTRAPGAFPSGRPTGGAFPSGAPTGGAFPNGRPSGAPGANGGRGFGGIFGSTEAQAALKACGITLPSRRAGAGVPSGAPTSAS